MTPPTDPILGPDDTRLGRAIAALEAEDPAVAEAKRRFAAEVWRHRDGYYANREDVWGEL